LQSKKGICKKHALAARNSETGLLSSWSAAAAKELFWLDALWLPDLSQLAFFLQMRFPGAGAGIIIRSACNPFECATANFRRLFLRSFRQTSTPGARLGGLVFAHPVIEC